MPMIAMSLIDPDPMNARRAQPPESVHLSMVASMQAAGQIQPIVVTPATPDGRHMIVVGHQRFRAARHLGWHEIAAEIRGDDDIPSTLLQVVENTVRSPMAPFDTWRAAKALIDRGTSIEVAAMAIGVDERMIRRFARLGEIAGPVLAHIEALPAEAFPQMAELRVISLAPPERQLEAWRGLGNGPKDDIIGRLAMALQPGHIQQSEAIFDVNLMAWDEDFFVQKGQDALSTQDVATFLQHQGAALDAKIEKDAKRYRCQRVASIAEAEKLGTVNMYADSNRPKKSDNSIECFYIHQDGWRLGSIGRVVVRIPEPRSEERDADDVPSRATPAPKPERDRFTPRGMTLIAAAKEHAINRAVVCITDPLQMLGVLLAALTGPNVSVSGQKAANSFTGVLLGTERLRDLAGGIRPPHSEETTQQARLRIMHLAAVAIDRLVCLAPAPAVMTSGPAANLVAAVSVADQHLPRLDTQAILSEARGPALREACDQIGAKHGALDDMRKAIVGNAREWLPAEANFVIKEDDGGQ